MIFFVSGPFSQPLNLTACSSIVLSVSITFSFVATLPLIPNSLRAHFLIQSWQQQVKLRRIASFAQIARNLLLNPNLLECFVGSEEYLLIAWEKSASQRREESADNGDGLFLSSVDCEHCLDGFESYEVVRVVDFLESFETSDEKRIVREVLRLSGPLKFIGDGAVKNAAGNASRWIDISEVSFVLFGAGEWIGCLDAGKLSWWLGSEEPSLGLLLRLFWHNLRLQTLHWFKKWIKLNPCQ